MERNQLVHESNAPSEGGARSGVPARSEVLVVGAGPVGLAVATSLVGHGHSVTVVDCQSAGQNTFHPARDGSGAAAAPAKPGLRPLALVRLSAIGQR